MEKEKENGKRKTHTDQTKYKEENANTAMKPSQPFQATNVSVESADVGPRHRISIHKEGLTKGLQPQYSKG